jgi:hypothetical protein
VNARPLSRWFVAILVVAGFAAGGVAQFQPPAPGETRSSAGVATTAAGFSGAEGVMPVKAQVGPAASAERGGRVKLPSPVTALVALALVATTFRRAVRRPDGPPAPLALRSRSLPRRAPPALSLG